MAITWKTVDAWRAGRGMQISELARQAGIPERTIYAGVASNRELRPSTRSLIKTIFPKEYQEEEASTFHCEEVKP